MSTLVTSLSALPARVRQELVAGTFERIVLSPFGPVAGITAAVLFPMLLALLRTLPGVATHRRCNPSRA